MKEKRVLIAGPEIAALTQAPHFDENKTDAKNIVTGQKIKRIHGEGNPIRRGSPSQGSKKIRRNDPCQCGSGDKQKSCCGAVQKYGYIDLKNLKGGGNEHT